MLSWTPKKYNSILGYEFCEMAFKWGRFLENHDPSVASKFAHFLERWGDLGPKKFFADLS